jgi:hypothetical protein
MEKNPGPVKHMQEVDAVDTAPDGEDAVIVFVRPTGASWQQQLSLFEIGEEDRAELVGLLASMKKLVYRTTPGRHLFMAACGSADFMTANLEAGKLYYVLLMPDGRDSLLQPVRASEHVQLAGRLADTRWVQTTPDSFVWARDNAQDIEAKRFKYYGIWRRKPSFERLALFPDDGR